MRIVLGSSMPGNGARWLLPVLPKHVTVQRNISAGGHGTQSEVAKTMFQWHLSTGQSYSEKERKREREKEGQGERGGARRGKGIRRKRRETGKEGGVSHFSYKPGEVGGATEMREKQGVGLTLALYF